jgi:hypothetical protein
MANEKTFRFSGQAAEAESSLFTLGVQRSTLPGLEGSFCYVRTVDLSAIGLE